MMETNMNIQKLSEDYSITSQIAPTDMALIAEMGFKSILCNRPDGEATMQPSFAEIEKAALAAGLDARYLPVAPAPPEIGDAQMLAALLDDLEGPVLAYCGTGARAANLWNMGKTISGTARSAA